MSTITYTVVHPGGTVTRRSIQDYGYAIIRRNLGSDHYFVNLAKSEAKANAEARVKAETRDHVEVVAFEQTGDGQRFARSHDVAEAAAAAEEPAVAPVRNDQYLAQMSYEVRLLDRALGTVAARASKVREDLRAGRRAAMPGFSVLGDAVADAERAAARLEVLVDLAPAVGFDYNDEALNAAYVKPFGGQTTITRVEG